jgi:hypothetical protein
MKGVMSVRLDPEELRRLKEIAKREKEDVSAVARELMDHGWMFLMSGNTARASGRSGLSRGPWASRCRRRSSFSRTLGVRSPLEYDDYLKGYAAASEFVRGRKKP